NTTAYKEYYACATGVAAPKPKASAKKKKGDSDTSLTPLIATPTSITTAAPVPRITAAAKGKQLAKAKSSYDLSKADKTEAEQLKIVLRRSRQETHISQRGGSSTDEGTDEDDDDNDEEEEIAKIDEPEDTKSGGDDKEVTESERESDEEETRQEEEESFDPIPRTPEGSEDEGNDEEDQDLRLSEEARIQEEEEADELYRDRLKSLETTFSEYRQTNLFVDAVSAIPDIVHQYMTQQITEAVREVVQIQTDPLQDSFQRENDEFLLTIDENMKKIIKGQVKSQVKEQVSRILPRIEESVNATLKAKVLTRSSHSSRTSYDVAADLSELELKKILIKKMEGNKSIQRSDEQRNLYKAREDDDQEGPSAGSDRGSKRRRERGEHASASTTFKIATGSAGRSTIGSQSRQLSANDALFSTIKVVSRHQTTQQYGAILPIELTTAEIRNSKAYKEYHACAMGEAAPKLKASARKKKGDSASFTTPPTPTPITTIESAPRLSATAKGKQPSRLTTPVEPTDVQRTEAEQLKIILKRNRQETHISQQSGLGTNEGTGSKPGVSNVPFDDSKEELSWNSSDDEDVGSHEEGKKSDESDDDRDEGSDDDSEETVKAGAGKDDDDEDDDDNEEDEELAKDDEEDKETGKGGDEVRESKGESEEEETRQEEDKNFDLIPRTPKESEEERNYEKEQELRLSKEARIQEEEDADELYRDVNINQGRGLQVTQNVEDTHVTLTLVNPDGPQESSSMSSFVSSMLNSISDVGVESIFTTTSSLIVSLETPTPIMTPSTIATITTSGEAPIPPPTIPSIILENLPTFNSAFRFEERLRSLETSFSEYRQTNQFADVVSVIPGIVHQYMTQQIKEAVQIQTDWLQDSLQRENDEFLRNIDENMKKVLKGLVKNQVKEQASRDLKRLCLQDIKDMLLLLVQGKLSNLTIEERFAFNVSLRMFTRSIVIQRRVEDLQLGVESYQKRLNLTKPDTYRPDLKRLNRESSLDVYSKRRIIAVTELKIVEWHNYKHLDWISVRRDDDKIYKFKEGDFKRLRLQDIEDMLLLLVQGKLSNLTVEERFAFNVSLRMFTRSIVIHRRMEDLQLGVESYQKRLNLTKPDTSILTDLQVNPTKPG
nr:hypothetical protein [Tanacetum cinerariifolium]